MNVWRGRQGRVLGSGPAGPSGRVGLRTGRRLRSALLLATAVAVATLGCAAPAHAAPTTTNAPPARHIPDVGHFTVTRTAPPLLAGTRLTSGDDRVDWMQSMDFVGADLYTTSVDALDHANARLQVTRLGPHGNIVSSMMLEGFNYHGTVVGAASSHGQVYIWLTQVGQCAEAGCVRHDRIYRVAYTPNAVVTPSSPQAEDRTPPDVVSDTFTTYPQPVVDVVTRRLVVRYRSETPGRVNYVAYRLSDAAAGRWTDPQGHSRRVYATSSVNPQYGKTAQSFTVAGSYAYFTDGVASNHTEPGPTNSCDTQSTTDGNTCVSVVDLNTGELVQRQKTDAFVDLTYREPEGLAMRMEQGRPRLAYGFVDPSLFPHSIYVAIQDQSTWRHGADRSRE